MIGIRRAIPADAEAMSRVLTASIVELCHADHLGDPVRLASWTRNKTSEGVQGMLAGAGTEIFVAERAGEIVGVGAVHDSGLITLNYVAPGHRFAGVSKAMLRALEQRLRELGFARGRLESTETAARFYRAAGWVETWESERKWMEKVL